MTDDERIESLVAACQLLSDSIDSESKDRKKNKRTCVICATICVVFSLLFLCVFAVFASGVQIETREHTEEYNQSVEGDSAVINNGQFEQYNDNATNGGGD